jgi:hypothetical protein
MDKLTRHEVSIKTKIDLPAKAHFPSDDNVRGAVNETLRGMFVRSFGASVVAADKTWGESAPCPPPPKGPGGTCWMEIGPVTAG